MWAVWQPRTDAWHHWFCPEWFRMVRKSAASTGRSYLLSPVRMVPWQTSLIDTISTLKPMESQEELHPKLHGAFQGTGLHLYHWLEPSDHRAGGWEQQSPQGQYQFHQLYRRPGRADRRACQSDKLVAGCNPELQAVWFRWHCHLYGWLSMAPECHHSNQSWHKCYCVRLMASFPNVGADFLDSVFVSLSGCRNPFC